MSQEVGRPVRLQLSREHELGWDNYGPAVLSDLRAGVDATGKLTALEYRAWTHEGGFFIADTVSQLVLDTPPAPGGFGGAGVAGPGGGGPFQSTYRRWTCTTSPIAELSTTASPARAT
jgi:hypothetical protein